ncbi:hypothetical protein Tco_0025383 [Tanacetum coccineum]
MSNLGRRLVSWQCKKQTIVAISSTEAEYVAAASCCAQVLWMQNQLLDYGFNFMNTEIHIDNESTICIVKNPVFHSKTKHIQIRHHFIRDCYEQRLINVVKGKEDFDFIATNRADLLFEWSLDGVDCFPKQVLWDSLRDIGYEGNLAQLTFSKPLFSPQWKYLVHVLLHCLSPKSTSWEQFGTNIASALVGLATNQKFNFSLLIMNGMLGHISNGTPFIMYPRFIQLFLNKQLEGVTRPTNFLPSVTLPSKVFTFMRKNSPKFSGRITPLTPPMLEVVTALAAEEAHSESTHSQAASSPRDAQGTPSQSAAHDSNLQDASQTSGGDEGLLDLYALNREKVSTLRKEERSKGRSIRRKWVYSPVGRNKEEGTLSEEHYVQDDYTADPFFEDIVDKDAAVTPDFERKSVDTEALERKSDETEAINVEEKEGSNVKSGDTEELDLETFQSTARQSTITPRTLDFDNEADEVLLYFPPHISRPRGLSIPGPIQSQPQQPTQATDPKDKGKGILVEEPKKKKITLQQIRALETTNDEEVARKIQAEWDAEEERKEFEELKKSKVK